MIDMEAVQFHPTGHGVAAVGARHPRDRGRARRRRGAAQLRGQALHVRLHPPHVRGRDRRHRGRGRPLVRGPHQQPPTTRAAAARRGGPLDQLRGEGGPGHARTAGSTSTSPPGAAPRRSAGACRRCTTSSWSWPASTSPPRPWRSGPTCHYMMGGVRVDAETEQTTVPGLFAAGEVAGGMHGANRLGGNSLSDLLVFGRRAGMAAADFAEGRASRRRSPTRPRSTAVVAEAAGALRARRRREPLRPPARPPGDDAEPRGHHPHRVRAAQRRSTSSTSSSERAQKLSVSGGRAYNPGWNLATDLPPCSPSSRLVTTGALEPQGEPGRPHPRGLPRARSRDGQGQLRAAHRRRRAATRSSPSRCSRCRRSCRSSSRRSRTDGRR